MTEKIITQEKHPGRVVQGHRLAALMQKRKEEILHNKEQSTKQPTVQSKVQFTEQPTVQSKVQSTVQSNYFYSIGILAVLVIGVSAFFTYNKKARQAIHKQPIKKEEKR